MEEQSPAVPGYDGGRPLRRGTTSPQEAEQSLAHRRHRDRQPGLVRRPGPAGHVGAHGEQQAAAERGRTRCRGRCRDAKAQSQEHRTPRWRRRARAPGRGLRPGAGLREPGGQARPQVPRSSWLKAEALQGSGDLKQARALLEEIRKSVAKSDGYVREASHVMAVDRRGRGQAGGRRRRPEGGAGGRSHEHRPAASISRACRSEIGKKDDAAATYGEALQYIPDLEPALAALRAMKSGPADYQLAKVAWQAGNKDEARRLMEQAATESPKVAWLQVALGDFRKLIGDTAGARDGLRGCARHRSRQRRGQGRPRQSVVSRHLKPSAGGKE